MAEAAEAARCLAAVAVAEDFMEAVVAVPMLIPVAQMPEVAAVVRHG
jgi:hypothetical protein